MVSIGQSLIEVTKIVPLITCLLAAHTNQIAPYIMSLKSKRLLIMHFPHRPSHGFENFAVNVGSMGKEHFQRPLRISKHLYNSTKFRLHLLSSVELFSMLSSAWCYSLADAVLKNVPVL
jgi:hypothetical protein